LVSSRPPWRARRPEWRGADHDQIGLEGPPAFGLDASRRSEAAAGAGGRGGEADVDARAVAMALCIEAEVASSQTRGQDARRDLDHVVLRLISAAEAATEPDQAAADHDQRLARCSSSFSARRLRDIAQ